MPGTLMKTSSDHLLRQLLLLHRIPRHPRRISVTELQKRLADAGYPITVRSIQRDLNTLSQRLPIESDGAKPQGWSWMKDAPQLDLPSLDPQAALVFYMAEQYLLATLPASTIAYLAPWFKQATGVLDAQGNGLSKWRSKVRVLAPGQPLQSPATDDAAQAIITQALLEGRRVSVVYQPRNKKNSQTYVANPLGLVVRDHVIYLVCTLWDYADLKQLVLHRIHSAEIMDEAATWPEGFNLDDYIAQGEFGWPAASGKTIDLVVDFSPGASVTLRERPLARTQKMEDLPEGGVRFSATVPDTREIRAWLRSFGAEVEVVAPAGLRAEMEQTAASLVARYTGK